MLRREGKAHTPLSLRAGQGSTQRYQVLCAGTSGRISNTEHKLRPRAGSTVAGQTPVTCLRRGCPMTSLNFRSYALLMRGGGVRGKQGLGAERLEGTGFIDIC